MCQMAYLITHQVHDVRHVLDVGQRIGVIVLVAHDRRLVDVVTVDVHDVGRMLDDLLGEVGVRALVYDLPRVGAGVENLRAVRYIM